MPGGQDFDVDAGWRAIAACVQDALRAAGATGADVAAVAATSMREGMVLYDAGRPRDLRLPQRGQPGGGARPTDLIREGAAEKIYAEAGDWVSDHLAGPAALAGPAPARTSCATRPAWACSATGSCTGCPAST